MHCIGIRKIIATSSSSDVYIYIYIDTVVQILSRIVLVLTVNKTTFM